MPAQVHIISLALVGSVAQGEAPPVTEGNYYCMMIVDADDGVAADVFVLGCGIML